ncbi:MAG: excinuclease ABC subunit UvrA [Candidatus Methylacidiphilales bacterium]
MTVESHITLRGARQHNLKNVSLSLPKNALVVFTGPSGSGKSSLAFDTLFAEGQRRYVQSLSSNARQFIDQMEKPEVDSIEGLCPAVAIEQRVSVGNPRSTVATVTEIYDFLRILYATCGSVHHPETGQPLKRHSIQDLVDEILAEETDRRFQILAPVRENTPGNYRDILERLKRDGFIRARIDGITCALDEKHTIDPKKKHSIQAVVDRLSVDPSARTRLHEAIELALQVGGGMMWVEWLPRHPADPSQSVIWKRSNENYDPETGYHFPRLTARHFSYNSPLGACAHCHGLGTEMVPSESLIVPDPKLTLEEMPIRPWRRTAKLQAALYKTRLRDLARHAGVPLNVPWSELPSSFHELVVNGSGETPVEFTHVHRGQIRTRKILYEGLLNEMAYAAQNSSSPLNRKRLASFFSRHPCRHCGGKRLRKEILSVLLTSSTADRSHSIYDFCNLSVLDALTFLRGIELTLTLNEATQEIRLEIMQRLLFLRNVGLGYLTLNRETSTLSGGEIQRIRLATQIGSGLTGVLYILDEPSIGLHQRDNERLLETLRGLRDLGNTLVVVEHDEDTMLAADYLVDFGPGAGIRGGRIVSHGTVTSVCADPASITGPFLTGSKMIGVPTRRSPVGKGWLRIIGARENNLQGIEASFPAGCLTCVTGVSGSGKSTLVNDILARELRRRFHSAKELPGAHERIEGTELFERVVQVDQSPIGRSPRSNPATYCGIFDEIRSLFALLPSSRIRGYSKGRFSFNIPGGRCENCKGDGQIKLEMQFLPDVYVPCESCKGRRFNRETLEITYKGHDISDILELTVDEAMDLFSAVPAVLERLETLHQVGLGYLCLGQSGTTLSGGEAQRVKLAAELGKRSQAPTLYLFDEPTTGLHFIDIEMLLAVFDKLKRSGHTLVVIEHHLDVIKCADWVIDLGPDGGPMGGQIVATGTPEEIALNPQSITGRFLTQKLVNKANPA